MVSLHLNTGRKYKHYFYYMYARTYIINFFYQSPMSPVTTQFTTLAPASVVNSYITFIIPALHRA